MTNREALDLYESVRYNLTHPRHKEAVDVAFAALVQKETVTNSNGLTDWISVEDRLPGEEFLDKEIIVCKLNRFGGQLVYVTRFWGTHSALWNDITHWMPLPSPPEEA